MSKRVDAALQVMRILWAGLAGSVVVYDVVLVVVRKDPNRAVPEMTPHLPEMLAVVALGIAVASFVLPRKFLADGIARLNVPVTEEPGEAIGGFRESAPVRRVVTNPEQAVVSALPVFQTPFLVGMALCEAIALFGFMLGFMGARMPVAVGFFLLSLALMAVKFPRLSSITGAIERATGASCKL